METVKNLWHATASYRLYLAVVLLIIVVAAYWFYFREGMTEPKRGGKSKGNSKGNTKGKRKGKSAKGGKAGKSNKSDKEEMSNDDDVEDDSDDYQADAKRLYNMAHENLSNGMNADEFVQLVGDLGDKVTYIHLKQLYTDATSEGNDPSKSVTVKDYERVLRESST